jgi:hypothetical protein
MLGTVDFFRGRGKLVIGGGRDEEEARKPAIVEKNGVKIALLAYCSVLRDGQAAGKGKAGIAPLRAAHTLRGGRISARHTAHGHLGAVRGRRYGAQRGYPEGEAAG